VRLRLGPEKRGEKQKQGEEEPGGHPKGRCGQSVS